MRLTPKRITSRSLYSYNQVTPQRLKSPDTLRRYTQSLDRFGSLNNTRPTIIKHGIDQKDYHNSLVSPSRGNDSSVSRLSQVVPKNNQTAKNLFSKLKAEDNEHLEVKEVTKRNTLKNSSSSRPVYPLSANKKAVKFELPESFNSNIQNTNIRDLLTDILRVQKAQENLLKSIVDRQDNIESKLNQLLDKK